LSPQAALAGLWQLAGLPDEALGFARLAGHDPVLPSSFAVGTAAQATIAAAALAACELGHVRKAGRQEVSVDMAHAALECTGWFSVDGRVPDPWDKFSGLYRCADGWVRIHANFTHHRDGALKLLGRADVERVLSRRCRPSHSRRPRPKRVSWSRPCAALPNGMRRRRVPRLRLNRS
jgi:crotonobetainyl-CoA:carnitine CoA-transferase CaiB-like acyl-CoA transferase